MSTRASNVSEPLSASNSWAISGRRRIVAATVLIWTAAAVLFFTLEARPIAIAGALAVGWSHLVGRCGLSHFGTLTPRGKLPGRRARWLTGVLAYVFAGALASAAVGAALAAGGRLVVPPDFRAGVVAFALVLAGVAAASELRLTPFRLPQPHLQTSRLWRRFPTPIPEVMWGFCLGLTVATVFTYSGTWLVLVLPFVLGEPSVGAMVLLVHWLGRATPILVGPLLLDRAGRTPELLDEIERSHLLFRVSNIVGIGLIGVSLMIVLRDVAA